MTISKFSVSTYDLEKERKTFFLDVSIRILNDKMIKTTVFRKKTTLAHVLTWICMLNNGKVVL